MDRIAKYPGWADNREMKFEISYTRGLLATLDTYTPTPGVFTVPNVTNGADYVRFLNRLPLGTRFIYSGDKAKTPFTFRETDRDQLADPASLEYLLYGKAVPATVALGSNLNIYNVKTISKAKSTTSYTVNYVGKVEFDLNTVIPNLEKIKQEGTVVVRYKNINPLDGKPVNGTNGLGWNDVSSNINGYALAGTKYGPNGEFTTTASGNPTTGNLFALSTAQFQLGDSDDFGNQKVTLSSITGDKGVYKAKAAIVSGSGADNETVVLPGAPAFGNYYTTIGGHLKATKFNGSDAWLVAPNSAVYNTQKDGQEPTYFTSKGLVLIQAIVLDATTTAAAKKAGINLDDAKALEQFISKR